LNIIGIATPNRTGKFEVQIEGGKLAWSKITSGKFPTTEKDMESIFACIEEKMNN
jgi:selT/selW/selH-like putative selenoprotein